MLLLYNYIFLQLLVAFQQNDRVPLSTELSASSFPQSAPLVFLNIKRPKLKIKRVQASVVSNCVSSWNVLYLTFIELQRPVAAMFEAKLMALAGARKALSGHYITEEASGINDERRTSH